MPFFNQGSAVLNSIIVYIILMIFIYISQSTTFFVDNTYQLKQFGIREHNKTILPLYLFSIILVIILYMFFSILESLCFSL